MSDSGRPNFLRIGEEITVGPKVAFDDETNRAALDDIFFDAVVPEHFTVIEDQRTIMSNGVKHELTLRAQKSGPCDVAVRIRSNNEPLGSASYPFVITAG